MLAEQVSFNEKSTELSKDLSSSLEKWFEKLVVKTESDFEKVRQFTKQNLLGEFSMSVEDLWTVNSEVVSSWASTCGLESVSNYVNVISEEASKINSLLDRLFIVPSEKELFEVLSTDVPNSVVIFSNDGFIFTDKINIKKTYENSSGILSRRKELETLEGNIVSLKDTLESIENEVLDSEEIVSEQKIQLRSTEDYINQRNQDAVQAIGDLQAAKQSKDHVSSNLQEVDMQIDEFANRDSSLVEELATLGESRINLANERESVLSELENLKFEAEEITDRRDEMKAMQQARELDAAKSQARSQALKDNFEQIESQLTRVRAS